MRLRDPPFRHREMRCWHGMLRRRWCRRPLQPDGGLQGRNGARVGTGGARTGSRRYCLRRARPNPAAQRQGLQFQGFENVGWRRYSARHGTIRGLRATVLPKVSAGRHSPLRATGTSPWISERIAEPCRRAGIRADNKPKLWLFSKNPHSKAYGGKQIGLVNSLGINLLRNTPKE